MNQRKQQRKEKKGSSQADCEPETAKVGATKIIGQILNLESEIYQRKRQTKGKDLKNQRKYLVKLTVNQKLQMLDTTKLTE